MSFVIVKSHSAIIIPCNYHRAIRTVARFRHIPVRAPRLADQISFICIYNFQRVSARRYKNLQQK